MQSHLNGMSFLAMKRSLDFTSDKTASAPPPSWTCGVDLGLSAAIWTWLIAGPLLSVIAWPLVSSFAQPQNYRAWMGLILTDERCPECGATPRPAAAR